MLSPVQGWMISTPYAPLLSGGLRMSNDKEHDQNIQRINELARKAKTVGLTEAEIDERNELRKLYINAFKSSLRNQLDTIKFVDEDQKE
jgi:uncharacterized protein YnzC (UPF0291/DUF896 family)